MARHRRVFEGEGVAGIEVARAPGVGRLGLARGHALVPTGRPLARAAGRPAHQRRHVGSPLGSRPARPHRHLTASPPACPAPARYVALTHDVTGFCSPRSVRWNPVLQCGGTDAADGGAARTATDEVRGRLRALAGAPAELGRGRGDPGHERADLPLVGSRPGRRARGSGRPPARQGRGQTGAGRGGPGAEPRPRALRRLHRPAFPRPAAPAPRFAPGPRLDQAAPAGSRADRQGAAPLGPPQEALAPAAGRHAPASGRRAAPLAAGARSGTRSDRHPG